MNTGISNSNPFLRAQGALRSSHEKFVLIGGFAVVMHGCNRFTPDLNVAFDGSDEAYSRLRDALCSQDYTETPPPSASECFRGSFIDAQAPHFRVDLMQVTAPTFSELWEKRVEISIRDFRIPICDTDNLVQMKRKLGRPQDTADAESILLIRTLESFGPKEQQSFIASSTSASERERREMLADFLAESHEARLEWLTQMLTELGKFCIIG